MSSIVLTILLLVISNCFMTFAWYGHLKLQTMGVITDHTPSSSSSLPRGSLPFPNTSAR